VWWLLLARGWALLVTGRANREDVRRWCRTQALRYLPGGIWAPVSRATIVPGSLLDRVSTVGAENVVALCCAVSVGGAAMALSGRPVYAAAVPAGALPLIAARLLGRRLRVPADRLQAATVNDLIAFILYAACGFVVQAAVSGSADGFLAAGAAAIAWGAGLVVILAPGGIGVREVVYVGLMGSALPSSDIALAAVVMRLVMIAAELGVLVAVAGFSRKSSAASRPAA
jgi:hypothetical protein